MIVYICGIAGVGKTKVAQLAESRGDLGTARVERVKAHLILCKLAGVENVDEYRRLPEAVRRTYQPEMFRIVYETDQGNPETLRLFDRHISSWDPTEGALRVRAIREDDPRRVAGFVLLTAEPESIFLRRVRDYRERFDRRLFPPEILAEAQKIEVETAREQAKFLGVPLLQLVNNDSEAENNSLMARNFLADLVARRGG